MFEGGVCHANAFLKQRNRLNAEERGDLQVATKPAMSSPWAACGLVEGFVQPSLGFHCKSILHIHNLSLF